MFWWQIIFSALMCAVVTAQLSYLEVKDEIEPLLQKGLYTFLKFGRIEPYFQDIIDRYEFRNLFAQDDVDSRAVLDCSTCNIIMQTIVADVADGADQAYIGNVLKTLCIALNIQTVEVCNGTIDSTMDAVYYVLKNNPQLTRDDICGVFVQSGNCSFVSNLSDWTVNIGSGMSPDRPRSNFSSTPITILHVSDIHYDPLYLEGTNAVCTEPVCCQATSNLKPNSTAAGAGYWGDYRNCDSPWYAIVEAFQHITTQHPNIDYIYFTGDIIYHKVWSTSVENNTRDISAIMGLFAEYFSVPVFSVLGNHEPHPLDLFSSEGIVDPVLSTQWIYNLSASEWSRWLPVEAQATILKGGFYSVLVRPGFRVIGINSNLAYTNNWWLLNTHIDPQGQLQWLADELLAAETNGESVHILAHIPSGNENCYKPWAREYRKIVERFKNTITGQFNGHTHTDELLVYYNTTDLSQAINVVWNGGSLTTFSNKNPNYKIFTVDPITFDVLDNDVWCYNITEANLSPAVNPKWFKLYSFKEIYGIDDVLPGGVNTLIEKMAQNTSLLETYFRYQSREADSALDLGCDDTCKLNLLCKIVTTLIGDTSKCNFLN